MSEEEGWALFDQLARRYMNVSGDEFVRMWNAGEITDPDRPNVMRVLALLPPARRPDGEGERHGATGGQINGMIDCVEPDSEEEAMASKSSEDVDMSVFVTPEESWSIFDAAARRYMKMTGEEFLRAWEAGEIENPDRAAVMRVYMLMPSGRQ